MPRKTKTPHTPEPTAAQVYAARRADIDRLIKALNSNLRDHARDHRSRSTDWGLAGDLGKVREDLINLVGFLTEMDPEEVEATLK